MIRNFLLACFLLASNSIFSQPSQGSLFIIGGGNRPPALIETLISKAEVQDSGLIVILPMASSDPDTAAFYGTKQFIDQGIAQDRIITLSFTLDQTPIAALETLAQADLVYITGGDQTRFMEIALANDKVLMTAINSAFQNGATISGTSAGAAVMSQKMITGDEFKHPEYTGEFRTIEAENMEVTTGLGLLPTTIIDQHFIYRMRMNRLITVALDHPGMMCIGIDESTAIYVKGDYAEVHGLSQVILLVNPKAAREQDGLLGGRGLSLEVLLPGDRFRIR